jgi:hypothetical protein
MTWLYVILGVMFLGVLFTAFERGRQGRRIARMEQVTGLSEADVLHWANNHVTGVEHLRIMVLRDEPDRFVIAIIQKSDATRRGAPPHIVCAVSKEGRNIQEIEGRGYGMGIK